MGRLAAEAIEAGALGLHHVAHGRAPFRRRAAHTQPHVDGRRAARDRARDRRHRAGRLRGRRRPRRPRPRVRAHPGDGRGERPAALAHDAAATRSSRPTSTAASSASSRPRSPTASRCAGRSRRARSGSSCASTAACTRWSCHRRTSRSRRCRCPSSRPSSAGPRSARRSSPSSTSPATDVFGRFGTAFAFGDPPRYDQRPEEALDLAAAYDVLLAATDAARSTYRS